MSTYLPRAPTLHAQKYYMHHMYKLLFKKIAGGRQNWLSLFMIFQPHTARGFTPTHSDLSRMYTSRLLAVLSFERFPTKNTALFLFCNQFPHLVVISGKANLPAAGGCFRVGLGLFLAFVVVDRPATCTEHLH